MKIFIAGTRMDELLKKNNAANLAAKKTLYRKKNHIISDHVLIKTIDMLVECLFIEDTLAQTEMVLRYLNAASEHYEDLLKYECTDEDKEIHADLLEISGRLTDVAVDMRLR